MHRIILAAIILTGCANTNQTAQRWADSKYNRCVDKVHAEAKTRHLNWRLEIDACMGSKGDEYNDYKASKEDKLPTRAEFEAQ